MQSDAEALWLLLPSHFRLEGDLMSCDRRPIERDFMVSARLNHLHVLFLLRLALVSSMQYPDARLITISANMLRLVIQTVVLKYDLANSGTSIVWRVSCLLSPILQYPLWSPRAPIRNLKKENAH